MKILTTFAKTRCDVGKFLITPDGNISYYTKKYNILNNMFKLILDYCCRFNFYILQFGILHFIIPVWLR